MLAQSQKRPFSKPGWIFEPQYWGFRVRAVRAGQKARLLYRSGGDATTLYPEIAQALAALPHDTLLLDGEVVVLDRAGRPDFQELQWRALLSRTADITWAVRERPATFFAYDLLAFNGFDVRPLPLRVRKALLARVVPHRGPIRFADHVEERGEDFFCQARARGFEGIVAKRDSTPYQSGRSSSWLAICVRDLPSQAEEPSPPDRIREGRQLKLTNLDKLYWPGEGTSKGNLVAYYRAIAPWLLPYLKDRPLTLERHPDGIDGKSFFQKDAPEWTPGWIRTESIWDEDAQREIASFICDDADSLLYFVNLGTIALHVPASRIVELDRPDWLVIDLDPKEAPFGHVIQTALRLHALAEEIGLPTYVKTSGQSGLHVMAPLGRQCTHQQARSLAFILARWLVREMPDIATLAYSPQKRRGHVYLNCLQNGLGKTIVAPFSVRPLPGAPVSTPLRWSEVNGRLDTRRFTLRTLPARMRHLGEDPLRAVLTLQPDLVGALSRLRERCV